MIPFECPGERLTDAEANEVLKDCLDPEDEDGMIPYVRKYHYEYYNYYFE